MSGTVEERLDRIEQLLRGGLKPVLTLAEGAAYTGYSEGVIRKKCREREIPHHRRGNAIFFRRSELEGWMMDNGTRVRTEKEKDAMADRISYHFEEEYNKKHKL